MAIRDIAGPASCSTHGFYDTLRPQQWEKLIQEEGPVAVLLDRIAPGLISLRCG
jgi:hypothetical protein